MSTENALSSLRSSTDGLLSVDVSKRQLAERTERLRAAVRLGGGNNAVAARSRVPIATLNSHLGGRDMKTGTMLLLARACGVNVAWLAAGEGPMAGPTPSPAPPPSDPQNSALDRPQKTFATINIDLMAQALEAAQKTFTDAGATPEPRALVQVMLLLYDGMNKP